MRFHSAVPVPVSYTHLDVYKRQGLMFVLANDAVALFFVITGYFNFGADRKTLERRMKHLLRL